MASPSKLKEKRASLVKQYGSNANDSGKSEVQVALITDHIKCLTEHFRKFPKDNHSKRGLMKLVGQRRRLLNYLKSEDVQRYNNLISSLELRK